MEKIQKALDKAREARAAALRAQHARARAVARDPVELAIDAPVGSGPPAQAEPRANGGAVAASIEKIQRVLGKTSRSPRVVLQARPAPGSPEPVDAPSAAAAPPESPGEIVLVPLSLETLQQNRVLARGIEGAAADAFRILRTQLMLRLEARRGRTVAICAPGQGHGKTLVAVNLAVALVRQLNKQAVLIDLDLRRPSVHRYFGVQPGCGVSDFLLGRQPLMACLLHLGSERLVLMPQAGPVEASSELLASPRMGALVGELKARYPDATFIYDCPPLLTTDDPLVAMGHVDGCLLVVHEGKTRRAELLRAAELVGEARLIGTVLNNARWSSASNYYYG